MPLPLAHSAAGLSAYLAFRPKFMHKTQKEGLYLLGICLACANMPDIDFVPGILIGEPSKFHPSPSHSIVVCLITALVVYFFAGKKLQEIPGKFLLGSIFVSLLSHPVLDYFTPVTKKFSGYLFLWPFEFKPYISSFPLFRIVNRLDESVYTFFSSLINVNNMWAIVVELLFSGILLSSITIIKRKTLFRRHIWSFILLFLFSLSYYFVQIRSTIM